MVKVYGRKSKAYLLYKLSIKIKELYKSGDNMGDIKVEIVKTPQSGGRRYKYFIAQLLKTFTGWKCRALIGPFETVEDAEKWFNVKIEI